MTETIKIHGIGLPSQTHTLITGAPGQGKTRSLLRPLLREYLSRGANRTETKVGLLLMDPKGDMLDWVRDLLRSLGREEDLIVIGEGQHGFNLFSSLPLSPMHYASRLSALANSLSRVAQIRQDNEYWVHQQRQILEALIHVAQIQHPDEPVRIADIVSLRFQLLPKLRISFEKIGFKFPLEEMGEGTRALKDFSNLPNDTRECVLSTVANCLSVFHQPPLAELMNPPPDKNVDLTRIVEEGKCVVVSCATRSFGNATLPLLQAVKEAFADIVLCRSEIEVDRGKGFQKINPDREVLYVADEAHQILSSGNDGGELDFLDTCREFKCRAILATQSITSLQSVMGIIPANRLVSLFGNHVFLNSIDPATGEWADRMFRVGGDQSLPPPLLVPRFHRSESIDWEGPQTLGKLQIGEFLLRTREGKVYRKKARLS